MAAGLRRARPGSLAHQLPGRLVQGTNLVNGSVGLSLRLYNVPAGGSSLYEDSNAVTVVDGLYSTFLGDNTTGGSLAVALTNVEVWLEAAVNGTALAPRERIASVAYALHAWGLSGNAGTSASHFLGTVDADGVALSAIQGLYRQNLALMHANGQLCRDLDELRSRLDALETR